MNKLLKYKIQILAAVIVMTSFFICSKEISAKPNENGNANTNANINANSNNNSNSNSNSNNNASVDNAAMIKRQQEIQQKQEQLNDVRERINTYEKRSDILEDKANTISKMLTVLDEEIGSLEVELNKTEKELNTIQLSIGDIEHEILLKEDGIDKRKKFLEEYMQEMVQLDKKSTIEIILEKPRISDYFQEIESILAFEQRLRELLAELKNDREDLMIQKDVLEDKKNEQLSLYSLQEEQRIELEKNQQDREALLAEAQMEKGKITELVEKGTEVASRLASEINALQSLGTKIDFGAALDEAKIVSGLTGVRPALLLGVLKVESNMGNNVGGGRYTSDMNPAQWDKFKSICSELGYDPKDRPVSRKPCYRNPDGKCGGWGGAMGPAQFMPSTWTGYKSAVADVTGHRPPDPWNLRDALTAMGLKLSKIDGVTSHNRKAEHKAASIYLAGGNWERFTWYGDRVLKFADLYEEEVGKK